METRGIKLMIRIIGLCLALVLITGCSEEPRPINVLHIYTSVNDAGELWVSVDNDKPLRLLHEAQGYRPLVSPDGEWLAVEVRLMSDLEVVRVFRRDGGRFIAVEKDVTAIAWQKAAAAYNVELEALSQTRARVSGWSNEGTILQLEMSAFVPGEQSPLETVTAVSLDDIR